VFRRLGWICVIRFAGPSDRTPEHSVSGPATDQSGPMLSSPSPGHAAGLNPPGRVQVAPTCVNAMCHRLQRLPGHASATMTMRYMKQAPQAYLDQDAAAIAARMTGAANPELAAQVEAARRELRRHEFEWKCPHSCHQ
jgi:hypothetical protein